MPSFSQVKTAKINGPEADSYSRQSRPGRNPHSFLLSSNETWVRPVFSLSYAGGHDELSLRPESEGFQPSPRETSIARSDALAYGTSKLRAAVFAAPVTGGRGSTRLPC